MAARNTSSMEMADPPALTTSQWNITSLLGVLFLVAAILQLISFNDFQSWFEEVGFSSGTATTMAVVAIVAEVWAGISTLKIRLMPWLRTLGVYLGVIVVGFWFLQTLRLVSEGRSGDLGNSGFFGSFWTMSPGWWTVLGISLVLFWTVYSAGLLEKNLTVTGRRAR